MRTILTGFDEDKTMPDGINLKRNDKEFRIEYSEFNERYVRITIGSESIVLLKVELTKAILPF